MRRISSIKDGRLEGWVVERVPTIDQFPYIKTQPNTTDLAARLWGINPTNSVDILQSLALGSIVLR